MPAAKKSLDSRALSLWPNLQKNWKSFENAIWRICNCICHKHKYHEILKTSKTLVVVDFTASWCGPCQQIKPAFKQFAKEYNAEFLQVDVDEFDDIAHDAEVNAMPTFQLYANGEKIDELVGANEDNLRKLIELNIGKSKDS